MNPNSHPKFTNTLFSSVSQFVNSSSLFPTHDRRIGLTVTCGYHPEHKRVMVLVEEEQPSFLSTSVGEYIDPDKAESTVRQTCSQVAESCRRQAQELIEHATRLERLATQKQPIIDVAKVDTDKDHHIVVSSNYDEPVKSVKRQRVSTNNIPTTTSRQSVSLDMDDI